MSIGIGARCRLVLNDEFYMIYEYTSYNLNMENWKEAQNIFDGILTIHKDFFPEPEVTTKRVRRPNGKKVWKEKKQYPEVDIVELLEQGKITIENASHSWDLLQDDIDRIAIKLLFSISMDYRKTGIIPQKFEIFY